MSKIFSNTLDMFSRYIGDGLYMIFFLLAFVAVCILIKNQKQRIFLLGYFILLQIIYWCPVSAYVITEFGIGQGVYWRVLWLLPMVLITAWGLTLLIDRMGKYSVKIIAAMLASVLLVLCGNSMYKNGLFQEAPNSYKLPAEVFGICDIIFEDSGDDMLVTEDDSLGADTGKVNIKAVVPDDLACYVRQYTSKIHLAYGRDGGKDGHFDTPEDLILYNIMNNSYQDALTLAEGVRLAGCNYLVLYAFDSRNEFMADYQIIELARVKDYVVYRVA